MSDFSAFADLMKEFIEFFDTLIPIEQDKLDATVKNRVGILEDFMHKEQAAVMRLRGLEQKREAELKRLGLEGCTFRQILDKIPDTDAAMLKPLFDRIDSQVRVMQSLSGSIKDAIEVNLRMIEKHFHRFFQKQMSVKPIVIHRKTIYTIFFCDFALPLQSLHI